MLRAGSWDLVVDTWSGAPRAARASARALADVAERYVYVSSASVYREPPRPGRDESEPTVDSSPDRDAGDYAANKRGAELAVAEAFGDRALLLRCGLVLGPQEDVGRLPWWLHRMAAGGRILAPGPAELPLQFVDARDLAAFALDAGRGRAGGPLNVAGRRGHATMGSLLEDCLGVAGAGDAELVWVEPERILEAGIEPWEQLPIWLPPQHPFAAMHAIDSTRAHRLGLRCRPSRDTVADTWAWLRSLDGPAPLRPDLPAPGLAADREAALLATISG